MPTYTNSTNVNKHLPASPPAALTDNVALDIADASDLVDSLAGARFGLNYNSSSQKFPEIDGSPATPSIIEKAARWFAVSFQYERLGDQIKEGKVSRAERFYNKAEKLMQQVRDGLVDVVISGASVVGSNLAAVQDSIYDNNNNEAFLTLDNINAHLHGS